MNQVPFVSVIMPARDAAVVIGPTLEALLGGEWPSAAMEVIVAVAPSRDDTAAVVRRIAEDDASGRVREVANDLGTTPAGLNAALAVARGSVIVRLDAHAVPARDYVRACVNALERTGAWAVGGPQRGRGTTAFGRAVARAWSLPLATGGAAYRHADRGGPVDTVYLGAWPRIVLERLGGFDQDLPRNQDYELCVRIRSAGGTVWLDPAIRTTTLCRATPPALVRQYFGYGVGRAATVRRHPRSIRARQVAPAAFVAVLTGLGACAPWSQPARRAFAATVSAWVAAIAIVAKRGAGQAEPAGGESRPDGAGARPDGEEWRPEGAWPDGEESLPAGQDRRRDETEERPDVAQLLPADTTLSALDLGLAIAVMHVAWGLGFWRGVLGELMAGPRRR